MFYIVCTELGHDYKLRSLTAWGTGQSAPDTPDAKGPMTFSDKETAELLAQFLTRNAKMKYEVREEKHPEYTRAKQEITGALRLAGFAAAADWVTRNQ